MQADGSALTQVYPEGDIMQAAVSPVGHRAAFVKSTRNADNSTNLELFVISASDWKALKIADIGLKDTGHYPKQDFEYEAFEAERAVTEQTSIAWSPDGQYLAFISGQDGVSADLYSYTVAAGEIRRLTDRPSQAYDISWSPDSRYVFHSGAVAFGTGAGITSAGSWVAPVDGSEVIEVSSSRGETILLEWLTNNTILVYTWSNICGAVGLQEINFIARTSRLLLPGCTGNFRYDRKNGHIIISKTEDMETTEYMEAWEGFSEKQQGTFLVQPGQDGFQMISDKGFEYIYNGNESAAWYGLITGEGLYALNKDGQVIASFTGPPYSNSRPIVCKPNDDYLLLFDWNKHTYVIVALGKGIVKSPEDFSEYCYASPSDPDLFFTGGRYAFRTDDWELQLVSEAVEYSGEISWMP